jgi:hypothetical protein
MGGFQVFKPIMRAILATYDPKAVVLQCGADSLAGDRLGVFNLSVCSLSLSRSLSLYLSSLSSLSLSLRSLSLSVVVYTLKRGRAPVRG